LDTTLQYANEITIENPQATTRVRVMAGYYFATFWCILFTGAIRKWMFPHVAALYLFQDIPIAMAYFYALRTGLFDLGPLFSGTILLGVVLAFQALAQIVLAGHDPIVAIIGLHHYLFYWPMLLIFPLCLSEKYRRDFIRWNLLLSIPMCLLATAQAQAPKQSFINRTSEGDAFGLPGVEVARVSGTFNFVAFFGIWVGIAFALCMGEWLLRRERRVFKSRWLLILSTFSLTICCLVSGSRQTIFLTAAALLGALMAAFVLRSGRALLVIGGVLFLLPLAAVSTYIISPVEFDTVNERLTGERGSADAQNRIVSNFYVFLTEPKFSLIGAGIGQGVDASHFGNTNTYNFTYDLSEGDQTRNVMELGTPVGYFYLLMRIGFLLGMIPVSVKIARSGTAPHVLPLAMILFAQAFAADLTRAATMTSTQVMVGYAFILGARLYPDRAALDGSTSDLMATPA
jgi:hypothetical protein